jgi:hypothetical protein
MLIIICHSNHVVYKQTLVIGPPHIITDKASSDCVFCQFKRVTIKAIVKSIYTSGTLATIKAPISFQKVKEFGC